MMDTRDCACGHTTVRDDAAQWFVRLQEPVADVAVRRQFQAWLDEFTQLADLPPHDWLMEKIERARQAAPGPSRIVVKGPLGLRVLRKVDNS